MGRREQLGDSRPDFADRRVRQIMFAERALGGRVRDPASHMNDSRKRTYEPCFSSTISAFLAASFCLRKARATSPRGVGSGVREPNSQSGRSP